jgi:crotonobetainyl-CoA:carnitine CoA-transferase CaiB-like acyl-CoA transferase
VSAPSDGLPCAGLTVVEVAAGTSDLGLGLAGGVPGRLLADLRAGVIRVVGVKGSTAMPIDEGVTWRRAWHRDKRLVATDDPGEVFALLRDADGELVRGPELDAGQTGYGPGYRIYSGGDGRWFALVLPDPEAWRRLASLPEVASLPATYAPLRGSGIGAHDAVARQAEAVLEAAFATAPAAEWVARLRGLGLLAELIEPLDRDGFRRAVLDDPVNRQLGRVVSYQTADWGHFEQIGPLLRCGPMEPAPGAGPRLMLPGVGEYTVEVLTEVGFSSEQIDTVLAAKAARQLED